MRNVEILASLQGMQAALGQTVGGWGVPHLYTLIYKRLTEGQRNVTRKSCQVSRKMKIWMKHSIILVMSMYSYSRTL